MGIRNLNRIIQSKCPNASVRISLEELRGKKIAVDTSIYMYRFAGEGALLENIYLMASLFRYYNIHAVFVFDGTPPPQKTEVIESRRRQKEQAKSQYNIVAEQLKQRKRTEHYNQEIVELEETMTQLRKKFARLRDCDIENVKELLLGFGFAIIDAEGEADVLCAKLAIKKRVYACLSDDTDMFVYGCPVIIRHISLLNYSVVSYKMADVLSALRISQHEFKMMCVVNGTDYDAIPPSPEPSTTTTGSSASMTITSSNSGNSSNSISSSGGDDRIFKIYDLLMEFKRLSPKEQKKYQDGGGFYDWLDVCKQGVVANSSVITLMTNEALFDITTNDQYKQLVILNRDNIQKRRIVEIMMKEDFIFIEPNVNDNRILHTLSSGHGTITTSPVHGVGVWETSAPILSTPQPQCGSTSSISSDDQVHIIANHVYGIEADSFDELNQKYIQIVRTTKKQRKK